MFTIVQASGGTVEQSYTNKRRYDDESKLQPSHRRLKLNDGRQTLLGPGTWVHSIF